MIWLPLLAAGVLALYPVVLKMQRGLPPHKYAQAVRAPAWFAVVIGLAQTVLALWALSQLSVPSPDGPPGGDQVLIGFPSGPLLMADAYTLWGCALLGAVLAVGTWVPAARRSAVLPVAYPFPVLLVLAWLAQLTLLAVRFPLMLLCWLLLLGGVVGLWFVLFRPARRRLLEMPLVLLFAALLTVAGLAWLHRLAGGAGLPEAWSTLLSASSNFTNGAVLLLALGWLGPTLYLPWWLWNRRDEPAMIWLPVVLLVAVTAQCVFVHVLFLAFPAASDIFALGAGIDPLFLIKRIMNWMMMWGLVALLAGSGWLAFYQVMRVPLQVGQLRPLSLVAGGLLLIGISVGVQGQREGGLVGLLWLQLCWVGVVAAWLAAGGMLAALAVQETLERTIVQLACWLSMVALVGAPPGPAFRALLALWQVMGTLGLPRGLVLLTLGVTTLCLALMLPRWAALQSAPAPRPGVAWGILAPFLTALLLIMLGLLGGPLASLFRLIGQSLLQTY